MTNVSKKVITYCFLVAPFFLGFYVANYTEKGCQMRDGIWMIERNRCVPKDCREKGICGSREAPSQYCSRLSLGDNLNDVYFWLGEPTEIDHEKLMWAGVRATIDHDKLTTLTCD